MPVTPKPDAAQIGATCLACDGTGQCPWCAGVGETIDESGSVTPCQHCQTPGERTSGQPGDGRCATCQGTGIHSEG